MRRESLNLASRGFSNLRPHRRAAVILSVIGVGLLGVNAFLYGRYQAGSVEIREELRQVETRIEEELQAVQELEAALQRLDLESQNEQVTFLNDRIAERTFPWSTLFDRLEEVLPPEVRLTSLTPTTESRSRRRSARVGDGSVPLAISGEAQGDEGLLDFLDGLFSHPAFGDPNLVQENREGGSVRFQLSARYLPEVETPRPERAQVAAGAAPEPGVASEMDRGEGAATVARRPTVGAWGAAAGERGRTAPGAAYPQSGERAAGAFVSPGEAEAQGATSTSEPRFDAAASGRGVEQRPGVPATAGRPSPGASRPGSRPAVGAPDSGVGSRTPLRPSTASAPPRLRGNN